MMPNKELLSMSELKREKIYLKDAIKKLRKILNEIDGYDTFEDYKGAYQTILDCEATLDNLENEFWWDARRLTPDKE